jgi:hypothetical protein
MGPKASMIVQACALLRGQIPAFDRFDDLVWQSNEFELSFEPEPPFHVLR